MKVSRKLKHFLFFVVCLVFIFSISACYFKVGPSEVIIISPLNGLNVFSDEVNFEWKVGNSVSGVTFDFYFGDSADNLQLIEADITNGAFSKSGLTKFKTYYWKVLAKNEYGEVESGVFSFMICDEYPRNPSPSDLSTGVGTDTLLSWECCYPEGATITYNIYLGVGTIPYLVKEGATTNSYDPGGLDTGSEYSWKVVAVDGEESYESETWSFETVPGHENTPPDVPNLTNPEDDSIDQPIDIALEWNCTDPDGDTLTYDLYFGKNPEPQLYTNDVEVTSFNIIGLDKGTIYYWKILAKDGNGGKTPSAIYSFKTIEDPDNHPPAEPSAPVPADEAIDQPIDATLSWECTDPDGDTLKYDVYFGDNVNPSLVSFEQAGDTFDPGELAKGTTYYWKIVAKDGRGGVTAGAKWEFETIPDPGNIPPDVPNLTNPENDSIDQPVDITLEWNCTDPDGDTLFYDLYFGKNAEPQFYTDDLETTTFNINKLDKGTTYYWKILAKDGRGGRTFSAIYNFKTEEDPGNHPPTEPSTPTPVDEATNQPTDTTLSWECTDPDGDTLKYDVYFGDNTSPSLVSFEQADNTYDPGELARGTTYYWKIVAKDGRGGVTAGAKWEFETIPDPGNTPPDVPNLTNPLNDSIDQPVDITLEWNCTDPDGDALTYDLYFGRNAEPQFYTNDIEGTTFNINGLEEGIKYYWKILAKDGRGGRTPSAVSNFTTEGIPEPVNATPTNNATDVMWDSVTLKWEVAGDGAGLYYDIYFGKDAVPGIYRIGHDATEITIGNLDRGQKYYWQVVATDEPYSRESETMVSNEKMVEDALMRKEGAATAGVIWSFTTKENSVPVYVSIIPTDDATDISPDSTLTWEFTDPDGDTLKYDIYFGNTPNPPLVSFEQENSSYAPEGMVGGRTKYYWKIVVKDGYGGKYDSGILEFTTEMIQWEGSLGGSGKDSAYSIQQTSDGGYIVAGYTMSTNGDVSGSHGNNDYWIVKLDDTGAIEWQKCLGGNQSDMAYSIQQTTDGGYIVAGSTKSNNGDVSGNHQEYQEDMWIVKLDDTGAIEWQKCFGGTSADRATSILQTEDGGYIAAGLTSSTNGDVSGNHGSTDVWIVKMTSEGTLTWQKCLGGSGGDDARSIAQTEDGGYIVAGATTSTNGDVLGIHISNPPYSYQTNDGWIVKLDDTGAIEWQKCLGGIDNDYAQSVVQTADGGYIVAGSATSNDGDVSGNHGGADCWIVKLDDTGSIEWQECLGSIGEDMGYSIQQASDGGYILAAAAGYDGGDVSGFHGGMTDYWILKLTDAGSIEWHECLGGSGTDTPYSIQLTTDDGYIVAGVSGSSNGDVTGNHGNSDYWIVKIK
jgi:hypothetical protein